MAKLRLRDVLLPLVALASGSAFACGGASEGGSSSGASGDAGGASSSGTIGGNLDGGGGADAAQPATVMPERAACIDLAADARYANLTLGADAGADGVAMFARSTATGGTSGGIPGAIAPIGSPCGAAADRSACDAKVTSTAGPAGGWELTTSGPCGNCLGTKVNDIGIATKGDEVTAVPTLDALIALALPIDTLAEAMTVLRLRGHYVDCDTDNARTEADGFVFRYIGSSCSGRSQETLVKVTRDGAVSVVSTRVLTPATNDCIEGRRPAGLASTGVAWLSSVEACFAEIAHMEAAAVLAFESLGEELARLGAPATLLERIERARADEVEHARITTALARWFGRLPASPVVEPGASERSLFDLAIENAVEGCVRETYGALVAAFQGRHAEEEGVRAIFTRIAVEESEHAELSHALDEWFQTQLSPAERDAVEAAKQGAFQTLALECMNEPAPDVARVAGMPSAHQASLLLGLLPVATSLLRSAA